MGSRSLSTLGAVWGTSLLVTGGFLMATPQAAPAAGRAGTAHVQHVTTCRVDQLRLRLDRVLQPTMQQDSAFFRIRNTSLATCTLDGYPGFQPYESAGRAIPISLRRSSTYEVIDPGPHLVALTPGRSVYFAVGWADLSQPGGSSAGCRDATHVRSIPPNDRRALRARTSPSPCARSPASRTPSASRPWRGSTASARGAPNPRFGVTPEGSRIHPRRTVGTCTARGTAASPGPSWAWLSRP